MMPNAKHPKTSFFAQQKLFSGLSTFYDLEQRIAALPDKKSRGDAFEVFAEAYLVTQRKHEAENVWPLASIPSDVQNSLQLFAQDYGVDGVLKTRLGKLSAYQVKFRTGRPALAWRELSTFMALADSPNIHSRILLTNCDDLPPVLNNRNGFFCIRGSDLERLEVDDFKTIEAWIQDSVYQSPKKSPLPHQAEAIEKILLAFEKQDRVTTIMACGTGKTLVALWLLEKMQKIQRILVLLPSLALLRQTLHEWLHETNIASLAYLCVCSDPSVKDGIDAINTAQSDLDFEVTTTTASIRAFLDARFDGTKIIFCTYQSATVVGEAMKTGEIFDLGIFDEAHKTAGREGRNFAFALEDKNLPIHKRLFMTATPRHYNPHEHTREGESKVVFSMDRPEIYGEQAYRLNFAEAVRQGIICGYKVIISVITSEMVTNELLNRGEVLVNGDAVLARQVANQISLRDAIERYGTRKVFTFHKTVSSAASFVAKGNEGICNYLPDFKTFHVNGKMPTARREHEMRNFRVVTRAVMSNARCLTEGVDVPSVDMVAFLSPKRSLVDIVQATGRAMRRSPGKTIGYVLVPLYVEIAADETLTEAVNRADYDEIWDVLRSLQEQDDVLAEIIRFVGEQKGRGKGLDDILLSDRIDFRGIPLELELLQKTVATRCLENLASSWDTMFGKLKDFQERFGHCNVETGWDEDPELARWVSVQRTQRIKGVLYSERVLLLDGIGFVWDYQAQKTQETWLKWYRELENYVREHGNPHVPRTYKNTRLASWVWIQRARRYKSYSGAPPLTQNQIDLLDKLGYLWDPREDKWGLRLERLKSFIKTHGHCEVGLVADADDDLKKWVIKLRAIHALGTLSIERKEELDSIGFSWKGRAIDEKWLQRYEQLKAFHSVNGNSDVCFKWKMDPGLGAWVSTQRQRRAKGQLSEEQIQLLEALGFTWQHHNRGSWDDRLGEVAAFKEKNGHCDIPQLYPENPKLGRFVNITRSQRKRGTLSADRISKLDALGFIWDKQVEEGISVAWETHFNELIQFKARYGHCMVPTENSDNSSLGHWVSVQRGLRRKGSLHPKREEMLNSIGFVWKCRAIDSDEREEAWLENFHQLVEFGKQKGHLRVPTQWPENPKLGQWVSKQRQLRKLGRLDATKEEKLLSIGFVWDSGIDLWFDRYNQLIEFKNQHGHCNVPSNFSENRQLWTWVNNQRTKGKMKKLTAEQVNLLNDLGFKWKAN